MPLGGHCVRARYGGAVKRAYLVLSLLAFLVGCQADTGDVRSRLQELESEIPETVGPEVGRDLTVDCPEREEWSAGDTFDCVANLPNGKPYLEVSVTLGEGVGYVL